MNASALISILVFLFFLQGCNKGTETPSNFGISPNATTPAENTNTAPTAPGTTDITGAALLILSGNNQSLQSGQAAPLALSVIAVDSEGNPIANSPVAFSVGGAGGTISSTSVNTGANGIATINYTAGSTAGTATVTASSLQGQASFALNINAPTGYSILRTSGNGQTVYLNSALPLPMVATVLNSNGDPVSNAIVRFWCPNSGCGQFSNGDTSILISTDAFGQASATYVSGVLAGAQTIRATVYGDASIYTDFTQNAEVDLNNVVISGLLSDIATNKSTVSANSSNLVQISVTVKDQYGNLIDDNSLNVTATMSNGALASWLGGGFVYQGNAVYTRTFQVGNTAGSLEVTAAIDATAISPDKATITLSTTLAGVTIDCSNYATYAGGNLVIDGGTLTINSHVNGISSCGGMSFSSLTIGSTGIVTHSVATTTEYYSLDLEISNDVTIESGGKIEVTAKGYLGALQGTNATLGRTIGNATLPSNTRPGHHASPFTAGQNAYGDFSNPIYPGSGGGNSNQPAGNLGGIGGGVVRLKVLQGDIIVNGSILADGGPVTGNAHGAAGGSIKLELLLGGLEGTGIISASGSGGGGAGYNFGGGGRIALIGPNLFDQNFPLSGLRVNVGPIGIGTVSAGTIYRKENGSAASISGTQRLRTELYSIGVESNIIGPNTDLEIFSSDMTYPFTSSATFKSLKLNGGTHTIKNNLTLTVLNELILESNATLTSDKTTTTQEYKLSISAGSVDIDGTSSIDVTSLGHKGGNNSNGYTIGNTQVGGAQRVASATGCSGASHGGDGGDKSPTMITNVTYGSETEPTALGAGGASCSTSHLGGDGGGAVKITANSINVDGSIKANGGPGVSAYAASGAGGSIWLDVSSITGSGVIQANGGTPPGNACAGGGGRIRVETAPPGSLLVFALPGTNTVNCTRAATSGSISIGP